MFEWVRDLAKPLPVLLDVDQQLEVQRQYLDALKARVAAETRWEQQKAAHKELMAEHAVTVGALLEAMDSGVQERPVGCSLSVDKEREVFKLERIDTGEVVQGGPLSEWALSDLAKSSDTKKGEVWKFTPRVVEVEGATLVATATAQEAGGVSGLVEPMPTDARDVEYWEARKARALGGVDDADMVREYRKRWCVNANALMYLSSHNNLDQPQGAFKMGAYAAALNISAAKNPFQAGDAIDGRLFTAWAEGFQEVSACTLKSSAASLQAATVGAEPAAGQS